MLAGGRHAQLPALVLPALGGTAPVSLPRQGVVVSVALLQVKQRSTGTRAGSADAYYTSPSGDIFRCERAHWGQQHMECDCCLASVCAPWCSVSLPVVAARARVHSMLGCPNLTGWPVAQT